MSVKALNDLLQTMREGDLETGDLPLVFEAIEVLRADLILGDGLGGMNTLAEISLLRGANALEAASLALREAHLIQTRALAGWHLP